MKNARKTKPKAFEAVGAYDATGEIYCIRMTRGELRIAAGWYAKKAAGIVRVRVIPVPKGVRRARR